MKILMSHNEDYHDYDTDRSRVIYEIDEDESKLAKQIYDNRNTEKGARLYMKLADMITSRGGCTDILYDLSADFNYDFPWEKFDESLN